MHAWGLRLRRALRTLALAHPPVLPSAMRNDVGTLVAIISQLDVPPACAHVNASRPALRLVTHDSGQDGSLCLSCVTLSFTTPHRFVTGAPTVQAGPHTAVQRVAPWRGGGSVVVRHKGFAALQLSVSASPCRAYNENGRSIRPAITA